MGKMLALSGVAGAVSKCGGRDSQTAAGINADISSSFQSFNL